MSDEKAPETGQQQPNTGTTPADTKAAAAPDAKPAAAQQEPNSGELSAIKKQLSESRELSDKLQSRLDAMERGAAEKSGDLKKVLELEKASKAKLQEELNTLKSAVVKTKIEAAIATHAKDAHNVEHLLKVGDIKRVTVVDGTVYGAEDFVTDLRKTAPHLFKVKDIQAGPKVGPTSTASAPKQMSQEYYDQLSKVKTAKEQAALRKQYGVDAGDKLMIDGRLQ